MPNFKQHEKDERANLLRIIADIDRLYSEMGGRDKRPERVALLKCMRILRKEIERSAVEYAFAPITKENADA